MSLGAFKLAPGLISQIKTSNAYPLTTLPAALEGMGTINKGAFFTGAPDDPQNGDEKVAFTLTPPGDVSVMAVQVKDSFTP